MEEMRPREWEKKWGQIVAKAWDDAAFKKRVLADPAAVLKEHGLELPEGIQIKVLEDSDKVVHLTIPLEPRSEELSEADLKQVAGGISPLPNMLM